MTSHGSYERLQLGLLTFYEKGLLTDVTLVAQGRELPCHKAILGAHSEWFLSCFTQSPNQTRIEVPHKFKVIRALVRFMYFGGVSPANELTPEDGLEILLLAEDFRVKSLEGSDVEPLILPRLTIQNCLNVIVHEGLPRHLKLQGSICEFVGNNFLQMLDLMEDRLHVIPRSLLSHVIKAAVKHVVTDHQAERVVRFCLQHTETETACDLLRESKQWDWSTGEATSMRSPPKEAYSEGPEWTIPKVRDQMETTPARIVNGVFFDWCIRLDYGTEGKLRIVYESAVPRGAEGAEPIPNRCINRFPAAMFAWRVIYRGQDIFNEKPVFICFPENVQLHWSTTLPVCAAELSDDDQLKIMVNIAENPMLSLILYYFSSDIMTTVASEDILNRLPHIEYRCLSSYSILKAHGR